MAIQYIFIKVTGTSASVATSMTDEIYDEGGDGVRGYYRCIDVGSIAGEKLNREDMKLILDYEKSIWGDATSRSTVLYWNSSFSQFIINFCGWASKNITETTTDGSVHTDGILFRNCELLPVASPGNPSFNTFGTLIDTEGTTIKLIDSGVSYSFPTYKSYIHQRGLSITGDSVPDQNVPVAQRLQSYFFNKAWEEAGNRPFSNVMFFKNGNRLYGHLTLSTIAPDANLVINKIKNNEVGLGENERHFIAPTKTQFSPDAIAGALPSGSIASAITSAGGEAQFGGAADSICIDSTNLSPMHSLTDGDSNTPITSISYVSNTGDDPFGLKAGGKSVNCTFWIPTLQGATATSKIDDARVLRFSVCARGYGGYMGIGAFQRDFTYTDKNETYLEEFVSDEKHRVCIFVKNSESPHSFKYSWTQPLTLTFKYRNFPESVISFIEGSGAQTNLFASIHNPYSSYQGYVEWLQLDPLNIMQEFKLDYSSAGAINGFLNERAARTKGSLYYTSDSGYDLLYNAKLGGSDNIDYVHGKSFVANSSVSSGVFSFGLSRDLKRTVSAVYPTSG